MGDVHPKRIQINTTALRNPTEKRHLDDGCLLSLLESNSRFGTPKTKQIAAHIIGFAELEPWSACKSNAARTELRHLLTLTLR